MTELFYQIKRLITNFAHVFLKKVHTTFNNRRSEEHTSELQSRFDLVCRLLLFLSLSLFICHPYTTLFRSTRLIADFKFANESHLQVMFYFLILNDYLYLTSYDRIILSN